MDTLNTIFEHHDTLSRDAVFADTAAERERAFIKAEGIRELIWAVKDTVHTKDQDRYVEAVESHFAALGKGIFQDRFLTFRKGR